MLIKAKERKTRWSLLRRVSQVEIWSVFPPHHQATATTSDDIYLGGERVPGFLSRGSYNGGGEGFTTYRLSVVMRQPAYAADRGYYSRLALSHRAWRSPGRLDQVGDKKKGEKKGTGQRKAGQEQRGAIDCITEAPMAPPSFRLLRPNGIGLIRPIQR